MIATQGVALTREELYERVWSVPTSSLAQELGITDVAIAKICRRMNVPKPPLGYWAKLRAGKEVERPPLPEAQKGTPERTWFRSVGLLPERRPPPAPDPALVALKEAEATPERRIGVPDALRSPHLLIRQSKAALEKGEADVYGMLQSRWREPSPLDIRVSREQLPRALRIMDALLKALEARGYRLGKHGEAGESSTEIRAFIEGEAIRFRLKEFTRFGKRELTAQELRLDPWRRPRERTYTPAGVLALLIDPRGHGRPRRQLNDAKAQPLESQLNTAMVAFVAAARAKTQERHAAQEREVLRQEAERRRIAEELRRQEEEERRRALEAIASRWNRAVNLRAFINAYEGTLLMGEPSPNADREVQLIRWAREQADIIDPLLNGEILRLLEDDEED